ncbi:MAG TPA: hypothetical protein VED24_03995 [Candidatus Acidoferrum sp.]|nr:hypothetical protein [Candidatus Acidoferrum sp.]
MSEHETKPHPAHLVAEITRGMLLNLRLAAVYKTLTEYAHRI